MKLIPAFITVIPVFLLVLIGWAIKYKKAYWLISGYNTMSVDKKKNVNVEGLGRFMGNACFVMAGIILVALFFGLMGSGLGFGIIFALLIPTTIFIIIRAQKYDGNTRDINGKMTTSAKVMTGSIVGFLLIISIGISILLFKSSQQAEYNIRDGQLDISGMYGQEIKIDNIKSLKMLDSIPEIIFKTNGSALGNKYKGYFNLKGISNATLYIDTSKPPFIYIEKDSGAIVILNCKDAEETRKLFEQLNGEWAE